MKKNESFFILLLSPIVFGLFFAGVLYHGGSPGGKTGSPGDDGNSCTLCHSGTPNTVEGWITSDIPSTGYVLGETYTIIATGNHTGVGRFGFELTSEDILKNKVGQLIISDDNQTQLTNGNQAITHSAQGIIPIGDEKSWTFQWIAPSTDVGVITFYAAFNAANNNGASSGDVIYLSSMSVDESTVGINEANQDLSFSIFPNPSYGKIQISHHKASAQIRIVDLLGNIVLERDAMQNSEALDLSSYKKGLYLVQILDGNEISTKKMILK